MNPNYTNVSQNCCKVCQKSIKPSAVRRCLYCNEIICKDCARYGLCPEHYQNLTDEDKEFFKKKYRSPNYYSWIAVAIIPLILIPYVIVRFDILEEFDLWVTILMLCIEAAFMIVYSGVMIKSIVYRKKGKSSLRQVLRKYKNNSRSLDFIPILNVETGMQKLVELYKTNPKIQEIFYNENFIAKFEFIDTDKVFFIKIRQNQDLALLPNETNEKPDFRIRIRTEQAFLDILNREIPVNEAIAERILIIKKGLFKLIRLARKSPNYHGIFFT